MLSFFVVSINSLLKQGNKAEHESITASLLKGLQDKTGVKSVCLCSNQSAALVLFDRLCSTLIEVHGKMTVLSANPALAAAKHIARELASERWQATVCALLLSTCVAEPFHLTRDVTKDPNTGGRETSGEGSFP